MLKVRHYHMISFYALDHIFLNVTSWYFLQCRFPLKKHPSQLMRARPRVSTSNRKNSKETSVSPPGMTGILLISLLSGCLSLLHQAHHHFSCRGTTARHLVFQASQSALEVTAVVPLHEQQPSGQTDTTFPLRRHTSFQFLPRQTC